MLKEQFQAERKKGFTDDSPNDYSDTRAIDNQLLQQKTNFNSFFHTLNDDYATEQVPDESFDQARELIRKRNLYGDSVTSDNTQVDFASVLTS